MTITRPHTMALALICAALLAACGGKEDQRAQDAEPALPTPTPARVPANGRWTLVGEIPVVPDGGNSYFATLPAEFSGVPYVAFDDWNSMMKGSVLRFNGEKWVPVGGRGLPWAYTLYPRLALDASGTPYVGSAIDGRMCVMKFNGSAWVMVGGGAFGNDVGDRYGDRAVISLAVGGTTPYVSFSGEAGITVMRFDGTRWVSLGRPSTESGKNRIAISRDGSVYLTHRCEVFRNQGAGWESLGGRVESAVSLLVVDGDTPYVACTSETATSVQKFEDGTWSALGSPSTFLHEHPMSGWYDYAVGFAVDRGTPYLAFTDTARRFNPSVIFFDGTRWGYLGEQPQSPPICLPVRQPSLAIDTTTGTPYLAYIGGQFPTVMRYEF